MNRDKIASLEESAGVYESTVIAGWEDLYRQKRRRLFDCFAPWFRGQRALEMGVADGEMSSRIAHSFPQLTIVDGSRLHLDQTTARLRALGVAGIETVHAMFEDYIPSAAFDAVFMAHILEHLEDPVAVLRRVATWLNFGGRVFMAVPNCNSLHRHIGVKMGLLSHIDAMNEQDRLVGHARVYHPKLFRDHVAEAGLREVHFGGLMVKPLDNRQMQTWPPELIEAFFAISDDFPEICSELYVVAERA